MPLFTYRVWRTRGVYANVPAFKDEILLAMHLEVGPLVRKAAQARTANWTVQPEFKVYGRTDEKGIYADIYPDGPGADNWARVSYGVPGHFIRVKKPDTFRGFKKYKPALRLQRYRPKTSPGGYFGGPGMRYGFVAYRKAVWWPGIRPRLFENDIVREVRGQYRSIIENAVRRGIRRAQREGH